MCCVSVLWPAPLLLPPAFCCNMRMHTKIGRAGKSKNWINYCEVSFTEIHCCISLDQRQFFKAKNQSFRSNLWLLTLHLYELNDREMLQCTKRHKFLKLFWLSTIHVSPLEQFFADICLCRSPEWNCSHVTTTIFRITSGLLKLHCKNVHLENLGTEREGEAAPP